MSDTAYAVESFELLDDGQPEKLLKLEGWFHARVGVRGMQLAIPDKPLMIEDWRRPSAELISMFGETGRHCRFKLLTRVEAAIEPKLPGARLLVLLENNDGMTVDVSPSLTQVQAEAITAAEAPTDELPQERAVPGAAAADLAAEPAPPETDATPAPTESDTQSWRVLTGAEPVSEAVAPAPVSEIEGADDGGFLGRLFGRKRQDSA